MRHFLKFFYDALREDLGVHPCSLERLLEERPDACYQLANPARSIAAECVVRWDELGAAPFGTWPHRPRGSLKGWRRSGKYDFESFDIHRPEYDRLGKLETIDVWTCDIQEIDGFSSSKSKLCEFISTDEMVEQNSREMIDEITRAKLEKNLAHREIRILHGETTSDHFARFAWDGRLFLMNSGGSHHLAAAKYIAARLGVPVPMSAKLRTYSLDAGAVKSLRRDFEMFVLSDEPHISSTFSKAMRSFHASWLWHHLPRPYDRDARVVLFPREDKRSMRVCSLMRQAGAFDFGEHLEKLALAA